jgi:hypothetical protein
MAQERAKNIEEVYRENLPGMAVDIEWKVVMTADPQAWRKAETFVEVPVE